MLRELATFSLVIVAFALVVAPAAAVVSMPVADTTITIADTGAVHVKNVQTVPDDPGGATSYHFDLQDIYSPENVVAYDYATGQPLKIQVKDSTDSAGYTVSFDKPYYDGYQFVVEYDCHRWIIYEGSGVYVFNMRPTQGTGMINRTYTVLLPRNLHYLGYDTSLDSPESVTDVGGSTDVVFHNVSDAGSGYAWEIRFNATGIDGEYRDMSPQNFKNPLPVPGMSLIAAAAALMIVALIIRKQRR